MNKEGLITGLSKKDSNEFKLVLQTAVQRFREDHGVRPMLAIPMELYHRQELAGIKPSSTIIMDVTVLNLYAEDGTFALLAKPTRERDRMFITATQFRTMETYPFPWKIEGSVPMLKDLYTFQELVHENAKDKGWWDKSSSNAKSFMLMVSELAEAMEADRLGNPPDDKIPEYSGIEAELADTIIRILDFAEGKSWDVIGAMKAKFEYNKGREKMHGGKAY